MKKEINIHYHLDNLKEFDDLLRSDFEESKIYYLYPTFWYDSDSNRCYLSICFTKEPNSFVDSITVFPPDVELSVDLYIQFGRIMEFVKKSPSIFNIQQIDYKDA